MKLKSFIVLSLLGIGVLTYSCSSEENQTMQEQQKNDEDVFVENVKFLSLASPTTRMRNNPTIPPGGKRTGLIRIRIARASRGCNGGFGLCDFKLFPKSSETIVSETLKTDEYLFEVILDETSDTYYTTMLLAEPVEKAIPLKVDDDIYWINDEETKMELNEIIASALTPEMLEAECANELFVADYCKVAANEIQYNETLGDNGGYQLVIETSAQ